MSNVDKVGTKARCISHGDHLCKDSVQKCLRYLLLASGVGSGEKSKKKLFTFKFYFYSCFDVQKIYIYYLKTFLRSVFLSVSPTVKIPLLSCTCLKCPCVYCKPPFWKRVS